MPPAPDPYDGAHVSPRTKVIIKRHFFFLGEDTLYYMILLYKRLLQD